MSVAGRRMMRRKLDDNWRYGMPDDEAIECAAKVFDIQGRSYIELLTIFLNIFEILNLIGTTV